MFIETSVWYCWFQVKSGEKDNNSDTSRETVTSDSGRGGSDEDFPISHDGSKGNRLAHQTTI